MRIPPHGRNINGSEPRVTEEKTNATSGLSTAGVGESAAQQTKPQMKEQKGGKSQQRCYFYHKKKTPRKHSSFCIPVRKFRCSSARRGSARVLSALFRPVYGRVFLQTEAPSHCGNQGGGYTDADLWMQHRLLVSFLSIFQAKYSPTFSYSTHCFSLFSDLSFCA